MTGWVVTIEPNDIGQYQLTVGDWQSAWSWSLHDLQALAFEVLTDPSGDKYHLISGTGIAAHTNPVEALLLKLARPDSHRTLISDGDGLIVEVKAVPDSEHYADRAPGRMAEPEETALTGMGS